MEFGDDRLRLTRAVTRWAAPRRRSPAVRRRPAVIAFNPGYLLDALGVLHTSRARLTFTTPNRPALMRPMPPPRAATGEPRRAAAPPRGRTGCGGTPSGVSAPPDARASAGLTEGRRAGPASPHPWRASVQLGLVGLGRMGGNMRERCAPPATRWSDTTRDRRSRDVESLQELVKALLRAPDRLGDGAVGRRHPRDRPQARRACSNRATW